MKKGYEAPSMEITKFTTEDVLEGSVITGGGEGDHFGGGAGVPLRID